MLTKLTLTQFKRFKHESIELLPLTLLTGINGVGKSSLIQSLLVLRQSYDRGELQNNGKLVIEDRDLVNLVSPNDMLHSEAENKTVSISLSDDENNTTTWSVVAEGASNTLPFQYKNRTGDIYKCSLFASSFQYLHAERIGPRASYDRLSVTRPHSPIGYRGEFVASKILDSLTRLEDVHLKDTILTDIGGKVYDQLSAWVSEIIYPGTRIRIDDSDSTKINLEYSFKDEQTKSFNPVNIGFGFSFALPVILAVLTSKPGSLLIVENPEAHLHPKGQSRMGMLLALAANSGVQVIIETHSDHVLNGIRLLSRGVRSYNKIESNIIRIYFFDRKNAHRSLSILPSGKLSGWPAGFFDEWENSLRSLIK